MVSGNQQILLFGKWFPSPGIWGSQISVFSWGLFTYKRTVLPLWQLKFLLNAFSHFFLLPGSPIFHCFEFIQSIFLVVHLHPLLFPSLKTRDIISCIYNVLGGRLDGPLGRGIQWIGTIFPHSDLKECAISSYFALLYFFSLKNVFMSINKYLINYFWI